MKRENFGSKVGAVLAAAGSAVGLGNIWRFPIETGTNGGAAFILVYVACIIVLGLPLMMSEFLIGRTTQSNTARAYQKLAPGTPWKWVGRLGVFTAFFIMCYYGVIAGWTIEYAVLAAGNQFADKTPEQFTQIFTDFSSSTWTPLICMVVFVLLTHFVIVKGVTKGIERWSKFLMPMLFVIVVVLVVCSVSLPNASAGLEFLLKPDWAKVDGGVILSAMGQAFFSLSLGMGCLCTYASYFDKNTRLGKTAVQVCTIDTIIALMAGFIIFPAAFSVGINPDSSGPALLFITLPNVFQQAFAGAPWIAYVFSLMFYLLVIVAALTSTISLHEVVTSYMSEEFKMSRKKAAIWETAGIIFFGIFCSLSFGPLDGITICGQNIFGMFDWVAAKICLPVGGMFISLFTGWYLDKKLFRDEITNYGSQRAPYVKLLVFILRYVAPVAIFGILLNEVGVLSLLGE